MDGGTDGKRFAFPCFQEGRVAKLGAGFHLFVDTHRRHRDPGVVVFRPGPADDMEERLTEGITRERGGDAMPGSISQ